MQEMQNNLYFIYLKAESLKQSIEKKTLNEEVNKKKRHK